MARLFDDAVPDFAQADKIILAAGPFSVSAWARSDDATVNQTVFWVGDKDSLNNFWQLRFAGAVGGDFIQWIAKTGKTTGIAQTTSPYAVGTWHHVAATEPSVLGGTRSVFIDGGSKGTNVTTVAVQKPDRTAIGKATPAPTDPFSGDIAHVALWNVQLTDAEVASLASGVSPLRLRRGALVGYWPVGGRSPELEIVSATSLNLTVTGTTAQSSEPPIPYAVVAPGD